jgi:hypothetical protein
MTRSLWSGLSAFVLLAMYYNFVRIHKTLCTTPAMVANATKQSRRNASAVGAFSSTARTMGAM